VVPVSPSGEGANLGPCFPHGRFRTGPPPSPAHACFQILPPSEVEGPGPYGNCATVAKIFPGPETRVPPPREANSSPPPQFFLIFSLHRRPTTGPKLRPFLLSPPEKFFRNNFRRKRWPPPSMGSKWGPEINPLVRKCWQCSPPNAFLSHTTFPPNIPRPPANAGWAPRRKRKKIFRGPPNPKRSQKCMECVLPEKSRAGRPPTGKMDFNFFFLPRTTGFNTFPRFGAPPFVAPTVPKSPNPPVGTGHYDHLPRLMPHHGPRRSQPDTPTETPSPLPPRKGMPN